MGESLSKCCGVSMRESEDVCHCAARVCTSLHFTSFTLSPVPQSRLPPLRMSAVSCLSVLLVTGRLYSGRTSTNEETAYDKT